MVFNNWCYKVIFLPTPVAYLDHSSFWQTLDIRVGCEKVKVWNVKTFNHVTAPISWGWDGVKKQTPTEWLAGCVHILHFFHCCKLLILGLHCLWDFKELWIHLECPPNQDASVPFFAFACLTMLHHQLPATSIVAFPWNRMHLWKTEILSGTSFHNFSGKGFPSLWWRKHWYWKGDLWPQLWPS